MDQCPGFQKSKYDLADHNKDDDQRPPKSVISRSKKNQMKVRLFILKLLVREVLKINNLEGYTVN